THLDDVVAESERIWVLWQWSHCIARRFRNLLWPRPNRRPDTANRERSNQLHVYDGSTQSGIAAEFSARYESGNCLLQQSRECEQALVSAACLRAGLPDS